MKRFNLLLVTREGGLRPVLLKAAAKVHKACMVFELPTLEDAGQVLAKLNIDLLVVDLDAGAVDLLALGRRYPATRVMGIARNPSRVEVKMDPYLHVVLGKDGLATELVAELKAKGGTGGSLSRELPAPARSEDFADFSRLAEPGAGR